ncbi:hypothetical protein [Photobacterium leiognathi]|nr:hypothetical protein [Photobacterium leiognathi]
MTFKLKKLALATSVVLSAFMLQALMTLTLLQIKTNNRQHLSFADS